jgi:hypothetical protein
VRVSLAEWVGFVRGHLINPLWVDIAQIDTYAMGRDPDGAGPLTTGYDPDFREPVVLPSASGQGAATVLRREKQMLRIRAQIEIDEADRMRAFAAGNAPLFEMRLIFHFRDLEERGLVEPVTGEPLLRVGDRLDAVFSPCGTRLVRRYRNPPGLYFTEVQDQSFGLGGKQRNLLIVRLEPRDRGVAT